MRLRHIEVFHAVMQAGTISGAAQVLHISQPAVTKVLQHCELQLGLQLFERIRGKLYPRPEAHRLFAETEKLTRDLAGIRRLAATLKSRSVETVRLVATPSLALSLLPPALACQRHERALGHGLGHHVGVTGVAQRQREIGFTDAQDVDDGVGVLGGQLALG
ncbi:MAG: LysR family transcriptional regulator, partial [Rubrivivax sp.]